MITWRTTKLVDDKRHIDSFDVSPDESRIAMISVPDETLLQREGWSRVDIFEVASERRARCRMICGGSRLLRRLAGCWSRFGQEMVSIWPSTWASTDTR